MPENVTRLSSLVIDDMQRLTKLLREEGLEDDTKASINATIRYLSEEMQQEKRFELPDIITGDVRADDGIPGSECVHDQLLEVADALKKGNVITIRLLNREKEYQIAIEEGYVHVSNDSGGYAEPLETDILSWLENFLSPEAFRDCIFSSQASENEKWSKWEETRE